MSDPWFQTLFADRIGGASYGKGTDIYKFEKIKRAKRKAMADHPERKLLDFGIGENDEMADPLVREALKVEVEKLENRGYADNGIQAFKDAAAGFMKKVFGVAIDPVCHMEVEMAGAKHTAEIAGITYYFCCPGCRARFVKDPQRYLAATP